MQSNGPHPDLKVVLSIMVFLLNFSCVQQIQEGGTRVIVVSPEILMDDDGIFSKLWMDRKFTSRLVGIVFDEGHCISRWGSFRKEYKDVGLLRYRQNLSRVPFYVTSATLSTEVLADVSRILKLDKENTVFFHRSND